MKRRIAIGLVIVVLAAGVLRPLDVAYASAMAKLAAQNPDDLDAAVMHAEAMMDLQPWDYYDQDLKPKGNTAEIVVTLESVLKRNPENGWSLFGLGRAMRAQGREQDALVVDKRFKAAWQHADVNLVASRF